MKLKTFHSGALGANCYVIINEENDEAIAVDIGGDASLLKLAELKDGFKIKTVLLTHAHFDHIGGVAEFIKDGGVSVYIGKKDEPKIYDPDLNLSSYFSEETQPFKVDGTFVGGEKLSFSGINVEVIATPGHTDGGVTYKIKDMLFCGDTLFAGSFGRVDFPSGNVKDLVKSAKKLFACGGTLYPGHGEPADVNYEKEHNPILNYADY